MNSISKEITNKILNSKKIVFVTGAGISLESGIPTYRGKEGLWRNYDPMKLATIEAFFENPELVWQWYEDRRKNIILAKPNLGHKAIAELENFRELVVVTQNIDGLHQRAGSKKVLEVHGNIITIKCTVCDFREENFKTFKNLPPRCKCGNILRPDVVWFGEPLPQDIWSEAILHAGSCDTMIIVGTSLVVSPANSLPLLAKQNNATIIEINPEKTFMSSEIEFSINESSSIALPRLVEALKTNL